MLITLLSGLLMFLPPEIEILSPLPNARLTESQVEFTLLFDPPVEPVVISLYLDGQQITSTCEITPDYLFYIPSEPLNKGTHLATLTIHKEDESPVSHSWQFEILREEKIPFKSEIHGNLSFSYQYAKANKDTDSLFLSYPTGSNLGSEANIFGQVFGGSFSGWFSRNPTYEKEFHGGLEFSKGIIEATFGDFYPSLSEFTVDGISPQGMNLSIQPSNFALNLFAFRTQKADTAYQTFSQYLTGSKTEFISKNGFTLRGTYFYAWDRTSSLSESIHYQKTSYSDTSFGYPITVLTIDTLPSAKNHLFSLGVEMPLKKVFRLWGEYARSFYQADSGAKQTLRDFAYSLGLFFDLTSLSAEALYLNIGRNFYTFGSPYLEIARRGMKLSVEYHSCRDDPAGRPYSLSAEYSFYQDLSDSNRRLIQQGSVKLNFSPSKGKNLWLNYSQEQRPYYQGFYRSLNISTGSSLKMVNFMLSNSYTFSQNLSTKKVCSHSFNSSLSLEILSRRAKLTPGFQWYKVKDIEKTLNQMRITPNLTVDFSISDKNMFSLTLKQIRKKDSIVESNSYVENIINLGYTRKF
ncbi:MAG: hypothetical protein AB1393_10785 [Candidatus Edwardsbacteria bacterium]